MCHGIHSVNYDKNGDVLVVSCTNKFCSFKSILQDRRKEIKPVNEDRRKI
jgi:hypothetical protein